MKTKNFTLALFTMFTALLHAQDVTTVNAKNTDISDNLDLQAVASIFGDSKNLEDFERRLNDPKIQISNLDLNNDGNVDYLRVIESVDGGTHLIVIQSVLAKDVFQDVATVEVEKDSNNNVQVQVVGDVYMYGSNYIYEPVYVSTPVIYNSFWIGGYRPYYSPWYWDYYPVYYSYWNPYPIYTYRRNVHNHINIHNHYNYVTTRRSERAVAMHQTRRSDGYERLQPNRSFTQRNTVSNRYELDRNRNNGVVSGTRKSTSNPATRNSNSNTVSPTVRSATQGVTPTRKALKNERPFKNSNSNSVITGQTPTRVTTPNVQSTPRTSTPKVVTPRVESQNNSVPNRVTTPKVESTPRVITPRTETVPTRVNTPRVETPRTETPRVSTPRPSERVNSAPASRPQQNSAPRETSRRGNSRG